MIPVTLTVDPDPEALKLPGRAVALTSQPLVPVMAWVALTVPEFPVQLALKFTDKVVALEEAGLNINRHVLLVPVFMRLRRTIVLVSTAAEEWVGITARAAVARIIQINSLKEAESVSSSFIFLIFIIDALNN